MYNNPYLYTNQVSLDRINAQISELEKMKSQMQQPVQAPTSLTQNFQLAPTNKEVIRYASSIDEVKKDLVIGDTPYFSKDMSVVWIKSTNGDIKAYELNEIVQKDEKDLKIDLLQTQIKELKEVIEEYGKSNDNDAYEPVESKEPTDVSNGRTSKKK
jgi:hypothetical protein